ncbi:mitochondrial fission ELM1 family protein [Luteimonas wenzhouensis]|uniref:Nucleoside-diphosphate sugar epimerase n=1 Tax=Luteimonas wenzhouensis TaxID=2599615 RepID=A0A5C5TUM0_9GAMM|nr:mitochondrial fission ELM1 family protein [Luteimonas wenzhouensis]NLW97012.1 nucleoside-diphosphate sugar epimerase [Xanthomonadaceae bacterium]TWT16962.1 nucleoside-diphosphate sugar epimerase [Luteimonas wenzhouensis]
MEQSAVESVDSTHPWSLSDGRAGNARQADALAGALAPGFHALVLEPRAPWRWLAPRALPGAVAGFGDGFARLLARPPRLAIGCGRQAALATRLLGTRGTRTVQVLDPRMDGRHWDLLVVPEHDGRRGGNIITLLGSLNPVDDAWLARARREFPALGRWPGPRTVLLLGGPNAHARYDAAGVRALCAALAREAAGGSGSVLATVSRRTPVALAEAVRAALSDTPGLVWRGPADGPNPYPGLLAWADRIVCSPDSVNMVSEACATRVPVEVFDLRRCDGRLRRFLDALRARGRIHAPGEGRGPAEPLRETARVAREVRERLGLDRD